jgi:mutator protein MutT
MPVLKQLMNRQGFYLRGNIMQLVIAAVIKDNDKYLITQHAFNDKLAFKWEFPGGKVEAGEILEECLNREIKEELNCIFRHIRTANPEASGH